MRHQLDMFHSGLDLRHQSFLKSRSIKGTFQSGNRNFILNGRNAQTMLWLLHTGEHGITPLEMSTWALRLGAYIHCLRKEQLLDIKTIYEPHDGGHHARYVLRSNVKCLTIRPI